MYNIIHIMPHDSVLYNGSIIKMIDDNIKSFPTEEHLFIISNESVYNKYKDYCNVKLEKDICKNMKKLRKYIKTSDFVFLHSNPLKATQLIRLGRKSLNKIIWCIWGHDLYSERLEVNTIYKKIRKCISKVVKFIPNCIRTYKIKKFHAIGIGFQYDAIEVRRKYGPNMKIVMTPYGYKENNKQIMDTIINKTSEKKTGIKVMVGHSAFPFLNHIKLLNILSKYKQEDIKISLVLAYGPKEYSEIVKKTALELFDENKIEIIEKMMSQEEYIEYLSRVDICLLDYKHQAALGNIYMLLYMGKKLFLNKNGIIKLFTTLEGIENYNIEDIDDMSFKEFSKSVQNSTYGKQFAEFHINEENYIKLWLNTITELKKEL